MPQIQLFMVLQCIAVFQLDKHLPIAFRKGVMESWSDSKLTPKPEKISGSFKDNFI